MYKWHNIITILDILYIKCAYHIHTTIHVICFIHYESYEVDNGVLTQEKPAKKQIGKAGKDT